MDANKKLALSLSSLILGMCLLAYASVPLYRIFCKVTGFGGTPQISNVSADHIGKRTINVRFDSNVDQGLPWHFVPLQRQVSLKPGENVLILYEAENLSDEPINGMAVYNVTPHKAGIYFHKIECFCFQEQLLQPHEKVMMPVSFYIDPKIEEDPNLAEIGTITLSYSFFRKDD